AGTYPKNDSLIFFRRQFFCRYFWNHREHEDCYKGNSAPDYINGRARIQCPIQVTSVPIAKAIKRSVHKAAEPVVTVLRAEQMCRHHWRQHQCDDPRNENCAGKRKSEFAKERAGESTLQRDGTIDRLQRAVHRK